MTCPPLSLGDCTVVPVPAARHRVFSGSARYMGATSLTSVHNGRHDRPRARPRCRRARGAGTGHDVMDDDAARAMIKAHFDASNVGVAGGGPSDDIARASEIYADDAVLEWPQGGERIRGKANITAFRSVYPARQEFELHRVTGCGDLWVNEY